MAKAMLINRTTTSEIKPTAGYSINDWEYNVYSSTVYLTKFIGGGGDVVVPNTFTISGTTYNYV